MPKVNGINERGKKEYKNYVIEQKKKNELGHLINFLTI
jgi:hypothetical protein